MTVIVIREIRRSNDRYVPPDDRKRGKKTTSIILKNCKKENVLTRFHIRVDERYKVLMAMMRDLS